MHRARVTLPLVGFAVVGLTAAGGCADTQDIDLVLAEATAASDATGYASSSPSAAVLGDLDCSAAPTQAAVAALCIQIYTRTGSGALSVKVSCHDAPGVSTSPGETDLAAFLRGLDDVAAGVHDDPSLHFWIRLLGYSDASKTTASLVMCGITPPIPDHLDWTLSPPEITMYLLCRPPTSEAEAAAAFQTYCALDAVSLFE